MKRLKIVLAVVVAVLVIIIVVQNTQTVGTRLYFWDVRLPLVVLLLVTFLIGGAVGAIMADRMIHKPPKKK